MDFHKISPITANQVPSVSRVQELLRYHGEKNEFMNAIRDCIYGFKTSKGGIPGRNLLQWKNPLHQKGLEEMASQFFSHNDNRFWPGKKNEAEIKMYLKQLFFRVNSQRNRNRKFKMNKNSAAASRSEGISSHTTTVATSRGQIQEAQHQSTKTSSAESQSGCLNPFSDGRTRPVVVIDLTNSPVQEQKKDVTLADVSKLDLGMASVSQGAEKTRVESAKVKTRGGTAMVPTLKKDPAAIIDRWWRSMLSKEEEIFLDQLELPSFEDQMALFEKEYGNRRPSPSRL